MTVIDLSARRESKTAEHDAYLARGADLYSIMEPAVLGLRDSGYERSVIVRELRYWARKFERGDV